MRKALALTLTLFVAVACSDSLTEPVMEIPAPNFAVTQNNIVPLGNFSNPCNGDVIVTNGRLHVLTTTTVDANGGLHVTLHFQPMNARGVGVPSGIAYNGTGITRETLNFPPGGGVINTYVNNFRMIAAANGPSFHVHETIHLTVDANGNVTATVANTSTTCM